MSDHAEWHTCEGCGWLYMPSPTTDKGFCGPCARERGLAPRSAETDFMDDRFRMARAIKEHRDAR
jgi:hypothetical protein